MGTASDANGSPETCSTSGFGFAPRPTPGAPGATGISAHAGRCFIGPCPESGWHLGEDHRSMTHEVEEHDVLGEQDGEDTSYQAETSAEEEEEA